MTRNISLLALAACLLFQTSSAQKWSESITKSDPTFYDLQEAFNKYYENRIPDWESDGDYQQFKRWEWFNEPRVYPSGKPFNAGATWEALLAERAAANKNGSNVAAAANWSPLGPSSTANLWYTGLGRVNCITFNPADTNTVWAGTSGGGIWKSTNGGNTWAHFNSNLPTLSIADIVVDPSNPNIIYTATGDPFGYTYFDNYKIFWGGTYSAGVMKSTNGGATWTTTGLSYTVANNHIIHRLIINPSNPSVLLAAASNGIWRTANGGTTWTKVKAGYIDDIEFNAGNANTLYATTDSVFTSTDGGVTWSQMPGSPVFTGRVSVETTPANPAYIYLLQQSGTFMRSTNAGTSWQIMASATATLYGYYDCVLAVSPSDANLIYVGGMNMCKSINGGTSWTSISNTVLHPDYHALEFLPNGKTLYAGSDGGVYRTSSQGVQWVNLSTGLEITQFYRMGGAATNSGIVYCGSQDNGTSRYTSGSWKGVGPADGMECLVDYTNTNNVFISFQNGNFQRSVDGGTSFQSINVGGGAWTTPFVIHPTTPTTLFVGNTEVRKSTNSGTSWTNISSSLTGGSLLVSLAVARSNPNYIYAANYTKVWRTTIGGTTWTDITGTLPVSSNSITYVEVSGTNPDVAWVTLSGYVSGQKVYRTNNGGATWTNISGTLPNVPANCLVHDYTSANDAVYVGTDIGVYYMDNNTGAWQNYNTNMDAVMISELEIHYGSGKIRAATYGRGLWESPLSITTGAVKPVASAPSFSIYPNPNSGQFHVDVDASGEARISVYNIVGEKVLSLYEQLGQPAKLSLDLSAQPNGVYFVEMNVNGASRTEKVFLQR